MNIEFPPELTKSFVLERVTEEQIFDYYGLHIQRGMFCSPLRIDRHPTCSFYRASRSGALYYRDYGCPDHHYSCFDFVEWRFQLSHISDILRRIALDFGLIRSVEGERDTPSPIIQSNLTIKRKTTPTAIRIKSMEWKHWHRNYWRRWDITPATLNFFNVVPIETVWVNEYKVFELRRNNEHLAFAYQFGGYDYKLYFPIREYQRFLHNNSKILQGEAQLVSMLRAGNVDTSLLVITKSLKDVMKFYEFGIPAVAPMAESQIITQAQFDALSARFDKILVLYDLDTTGIMSMKRMRDTYGLRPVWVPRFYKSKDFTELYATHGQRETESFINYLYNLT